MQGKIKHIAGINLCTETGGGMLLYDFFRFFGLLQCFCCGKGVSPLCCTCRTNIRYALLVREKLLETAFSPRLQWYFDAIYEYTKPIKKLLTTYKYLPARMVQRVIVELLNEYLRTDPFRCIDTMIHRFNQSPVLLLPVPMSGEKRKLRGFSPAYEIAIVLGRYLSNVTTASVYISDCLLEKQHQLSAQAGKNRRERLLTVHRLYSVIPGFVQAIREYAIDSIVLVDDVVTTRATVTTLAEKMSQALIIEELMSIRCSVFSFAAVLRNLNS